MNLKNIRTVTWEFPQNALGFLVSKLFKAKYIAEYGEANVYQWKFKYGSMSLGKYIFMHDPADLETIMHEYGHTRQSKHLGLLYLLVIGLPSFIWAWCCGGYRKKKGKTYYWFYTEAWADKLGGVERNKR